MVTLIINGKPRALEGPTNLMDFLRDNKINTQFVAVAHNRVILQKKDLAITMLNDGDVLELVQPVGGG